MSISREHGGFDTIFVCFSSFSRYSSLKQFPSAVLAPRSFFPTDEGCSVRGSCRQAFVRNTYSDKIPWLQHGRRALGPITRPINKCSRPPARLSRWRPRTKFAISEKGGIKSPRGFSRGVETFATSLRANARTRFNACAFSTFTG